MKEPNIAKAQPLNQMYKVKCTEINLHLFGKILTESVLTFFDARLAEFGANVNAQKAYMKGSQSN